MLRKLFFIALATAATASDGPKDLSGKAWQLMQGTSEGATIRNSYLMGWYWGFKYGLITGELKAHTELSRRLFNCKTTLTEVSAGINRYLAAHPEKIEEPLGEIAEDAMENVCTTPDSR